MEMHMKSDKDQEHHLKKVMSQCCLCVLLLVSQVFYMVGGGCSFANQGLAASRLNDLDAAKFAAKMAIAHQGMDVETLKERQKRNAEEEPYIPTFVTGEADNQEEASELDEKNVESEIWELSERSNKNNPKQDLGKIDDTLKSIEISGCPHAQAANARIEL